MSDQKTVIIWDDCVDSEIGFFVIEGDKRAWHNQYRRVDNIDYPGDGYYDLVWNEGERRVPLEEFPTTAVLEGAFVIVCGILP